MKRDFFIHLGFFVSLFFLLTVLNGGFSWAYLALWVGGALGTILPDLDHLIYIYFLSPMDLTSQRVARSLSKKDVLNGLLLLYITRRERTKLIFHTAFFQIIFLLLTFFVITSSGSLLGKGVVLGFSIHIFVDQLLDLLEVGNLDSWFKNITFLLNFQMDRQKYWIYFSVIGFVTLLFALVF